MCNCIKDIETTLRMKYGATLTLVTGSDYGFKLKDGWLAFVLPVPVQYISLKAKNAGKYVKTQEHVYARYCPFCGEKLYSPDEKENQTP